MLHGGRSGSKTVQKHRNPEGIKHLEYKDYRFDVPGAGTITFKIWFDEGVLPENWPATQERKRRSLPGTKPQEEIVSAEHQQPLFPEFVELQFILQGKEERRVMAEEVGRYFGVKHDFLGAPSLAYRIGGYILSKNGLLGGLKN